MRLRDALAIFTIPAPAGLSAAEQEAWSSAGVCALAILPCLLGPATAHANGDTINIEEISCREMLTMDGEQRDLTLLFMHGFVSGENAAVELDESELSETNEAILETCVDNPSDSVLSVFHKVGK